MGEELTRPFRDARTIPLYTIVARTQGYTYAAKEWAVCFVQGPFSVAPRQNPYRYDSQLFHRCIDGRRVWPSCCEGLGFARAHACYST